MVIFDDCIRNILDICKVKTNVMGRTVTASLDTHYEEFIKSIIACGRYNNVSEVIRAAFRNLEENESRFAALKAALAEGEACPDVVDFDPDLYLKELKAKKRKDE